MYAGMRAIKITSNWENISVNEWNVIIYLINWDYLQTQHKIEMDKRDGKFGPVMAVPPMQQMSRIDQPFPPSVGYPPQPAYGQPYGYPQPQAQGYPPAYPSAYPPPGYSRWSYYNITSWFATSGDFWVLQFQVMPLYKVPLSILTWTSGPGTLSLIIYF